MSEGVKIHQSNPSGVCRKCIQGLDNDIVKPGVLKQLSLKYPNLRIEVSEVKGKWKKQFCDDEWKIYTIVEDTMEIFKLNKKNKCVFAIKLAERASRYIVDTEKLTLINNAIEIALTFVQTEKENGEVLYNFLDNENNGFTIFQEMEIDEKIRDAWDCIIDAIAYITKEIYLVNGEKYFPEPIEMVDDTIFTHMINALKLCSSEEVEFLENLYKDCFNNQKA